MNNIHKIIIVCALGYFMDVFDIQLIAVLRMDSLKALGVPVDALSKIGGNILTCQMMGMIAGAFVWGWLGDRYGRLRALMGSILVYSLGTLACAAVQDIYMYGALRFITGFGLAGETGAAITLVAESMSQKNRGWGVTVIAGFGMFGPVVAVLLASLLDWRLTYLAAGLMGLTLLAVRARLAESSLFKALGAHSNLARDPRALFSSTHLPVLLLCILVGLPGIYAFSLLNFFSAEFAKDFVAGPGFSQRIALICFYLGCGFGDCISGALSQFLQSRRKAILLFLTMGALLTAFYLLYGRIFGFSVDAFYLIYGGFGLVAGYWVLFALLAAEHFGTNLRASAAIVTVNLIRGFTIIMVPVFTALSPAMGHGMAALLIGGVLYTGAFYALARLRETHHASLNYVDRAA